MVNYNIPISMPLQSIADIKHAYYINLESRPDRKTHVETQLAQLGIVAQRFNAISLANGALGCSFSHLKLLEMAKANQWEHLLIVEDDILFTNPTLFAQQCNRFLSKHSNFDVCIWAGNNFPPYAPVDDTCVKVTRCQTTTGYLVQQHYYDTLIQNYRTSIQCLMREPQNHVLYAIDKYWFHLQAVDTWYLIIPLTVTQKEDYSNIEKRYTNYTPAMLDLDKRAYFRR